MEKLNRLSFGFPAIQNDVKLGNILLSFQVDYYLKFGVTFTHTTRHVLLCTYFAISITVTAHAGEFAGQIGSC
jgi:hypothetical protein